MLIKFTNRYVIIANTNLNVDKLLRNRWEVFCNVNHTCCFTFLLVTSYPMVLQRLVQTYLIYTFLISIYTWTLDTEHSQLSSVNAIFYVRICPPFFPSVKSCNPQFGIECLINWNCTNNTTLILCSGYFLWLYIFISKTIQNHT